MGREGTLALVQLSRTIASLMRRGTVGLAELVELVLSGAALDALKIIPVRISTAWPYAVAFPVLPVPSGVYGSVHSPAWTFSESMMVKEAPFLMSEADIRTWTAGGTFPAAVEAA